MAVIDVNWNPPSKQLRQFAGLLILFGGIAGFLFFKKDWVSLATAQWIWGVCAGLGLVGLALPVLIRPVYVVMMAISFPIGLVISTVLLGIIFYLVITPVGLLMRLLGYDAMHRKLDPAMTSYWIKRPAQTAVGRYFRQF